MPMPNLINRRNFIKSTSVVGGLTMMPKVLAGTSSQFISQVTSVQASPQKLKSISIHIGVNRVDPNCYNNNRFAELIAPENDAYVMYGLAQRALFDYSVPPILSKDATIQRVKTEIEFAAKYLDSDGILFISYSGHGMSMPDNSGDENKITPSDKEDEAWVLYDGALVDDEIYALWKNFDSISNARILVISDSCFSGTILERFISPEFTAANLSDEHAPEMEIKVIPDDMAKNIYYSNRFHFEAIQKRFGMIESGTLQSQLLLLSACQDGQEGQYATDGRILGLFTACLLQVWRNGAFTGTYLDFYRQIVAAMQSHISPLIQRPNFFSSRVNGFGFSESPFSI